MTDMKTLREALVLCMEGDIQAADRISAALDELEALRQGCVLEVRRALEMEIVELQAQRDELLAALKAVDQGEVSVLAEDGSAWQALEDETWRLVRAAIADAAIAKAGGK